MNKVAAEVCEQEFDRFVEENDILIESDSMSKEDQDEFKTQKSYILRAMSRGALIINDKGEPVYTPSRVADAPALTFREPTGATLMAMDRKKQNEDIGKMYVTMGDMAGVTAKTFSQMKMADLKVCMAIATLFLG